MSDADRNDVEFRDARLIEIGRPFEDLVQVVLVTALLIGPLPEGTEQAGLRTDIGIVQVAIHDKIGILPIQRRRPGIGQLGKSFQVWRIEEVDPIGHIKPLVGIELQTNTLEIGIASLHTIPRNRRHVMGTTALKGGQFITGL